MNATAADVLSGSAPWSVECGDCLPWLQSLPARSVSAFLTSPPYEAQRTYSVGFKRQGQEWVDWLRPIIREMCRASAGLVFFNALCPVREWSYSPALEWLVADLTRLDGIACGPRPYAWVKSENHDEADGNGIPGSGSHHYQRSDWEPVYAFALPDRLAGKNSDFWSDNTAFGQPPKYGAGGEFSGRRKDGTRDNEGRKKHSALANSPGTTRRANGGWRRTKRVPAAGGDVMREQNYAPPTLSNPGNVIRAPVGGGKMGHPLAHEGEAPMTLSVAERFACWFVPPGGVIGDPFTGTGTTGHAALNHGRRFVGCDLRESQVELTRRRLRSVTPTLFAEDAA